MQEQLETPAAELMNGSMFNVIDFEYRGVLRVVKSDAEGVEEAGSSKYPGNRKFFAKTRANTNLPIESD